MVVHWIEILRVKRPQITWRSLFITPVGGGSIPQIPLYTPGKGQRTAYWVLSPQVEEDVDRIQTLLKETFYFNYFIDNLISYFTLVFTFICMYTYKHPLRTIYLYSKSPFGTTLVCQSIFVNRHFWDISLRDFYLRCFALECGWIQFSWALTLTFCSRTKDWSLK